jgi:hypothetical protein
MESTREDEQVTDHTAAATTARHWDGWEFMENLPFHVEVVGHGGAVAFGAHATDGKEFGAEHGAAGALGHVEHPLLDPRGVDSNRQRRRRSRS